MPAAHGQGEFGAEPPRYLTRSLTVAVVAAASLVVVLGFVQIVSWLFEAPQVLAGALSPGGGQAVGTDGTTTTTSPAPTVPPSTTPTTLPIPTTPNAYVVPVIEPQVAAKQLAVDIALHLTNYEAGVVYIDHVRGLVPPHGLNALLNASGPLVHAGHWSRGEVIYPQLGGFRNNKMSVMVVTKQTIGIGDDPTQELIRVLDIRLVKQGAIWVFDHLSSAGGTFDNPAALRLAHQVTNDPRIEMPDSARLDILRGMVSPTLLELMLEIADVTPFGVAVLSTGHPYNVFETDRQSHHTIGRAVDIYRVGDLPVVEDRAAEGSSARSLIEWLYTHPSVRQVGGPWDIDGPASSRSFTDAVHQDHIHVAVNG